MDARQLVDIACDEDPRAPCLWAPSDLFAELCESIRQQPNVAGVVIYRHKTIRDGGPYCDVTTRAP
ncbi:hypothetical protein [Phenylobacterium sp.]|uniref:hypothetical protein n=1 Tax=Phenylobacterium sp. TaxID=1871053 RepID=UPI0025D2E0CC|nr:hypothetical protein [Phenylobacterium sp.]